MGGHSKSSSQRAVSHEDKLKQKGAKRDAKAERRAEELTIIASVSPHNVAPSAATPAAAAASLVGTSPKRQPKKPVACVVEDDEMSNKRARSGEPSHGAPSHGAPFDITDSSKLDDLWRKLPDFGRKFDLVEQHTKDMQQHGAELAELRARVTKLEDSKGLPTYGGVVPTPPPPCPEACASIFTKQTLQHQQLLQPHLQQQQAHASPT
eukprot:4017214-Amphidinium_carterae.1